MKKKKAFNWDLPVAKKNNQLDETDEETNKLSFLTSIILLNCGNSAENANRTRKLKINIFWLAIFVSFRN